MSRPRAIVLQDENYQALADHFAAQLLRLGYVYRSSRSRYNCLIEFLHWLETQGQLDITAVTTLHIRQYYEYLSHRPNRTSDGILSPKTTHSHMRIIRDLFSLLQNEGRISVNPCSTLSFPYPRQQAERAILTQAQIRQVYQHCHSAQERAILSLAYGCGLRVGELEKCNTQDIRLKDSLLIVPQGKGNKRRVVPLSSGVAKDLSHYFYHERNKLTEGRDFKTAGAAFMLNCRGGRMRKWTYNKYLKAIIARTGNADIMEKQITMHSLRHSIATHLLEQGLTVHQVRQFLGHNQLETTQQYTHISQQQLQQLLDV